MNGLVKLNCSGFTRSARFFLPRSCRNHRGKTRSHREESLALTAWSHREEIQDIGNVVITGASAGVGRATPVEFARRGWNIGLIARGAEGLAGAKADVENAGGNALVLPLDVSDPCAAGDAARKFIAEWKSIDVWINCAIVTVFSLARLLFLILASARTSRNANFALTS
jgi:hypothetical protein